MNIEHSCEKCNYSTKLKQSYDRHLLSKKHIEDKMTVIEETNIHVCSFCNKRYKYRSGLCNHKRTCTVKLVNPETNHISDIENTLNKKIEETVGKSYESIKTLIMEYNKNQIHPTAYTNVIIENQYTTNNISSQI